MCIYIYICIYLGSKFRFQDLAALDHVVGCVSRIVSAWLLPSLPEPMISEHVNEMAARESEGGPAAKAKRRRIRRRVVQARCRLLLLSELGMWRKWSWFGATQLRDMDETIAWQSTATVLDALLPKEEAKGGNDMVAFLGKGRKGKEFETKTVHKGKEFEKHFVENDDKRTTVQKGKEFETESAKDKPLPAPGHLAKPVPECIPQPFKDSNPTDPVKYAGKPNKKRHVESCSGLQSLVGDVPQSVAETPDFRGDQVIRNYWHGLR